MCSALDIIIKYIAWQIWLAMGLTCPQVSFEGTINITFLITLFAEQGSVQFCMVLPNIALFLNNILSLI